MNERQLEQTHVDETIEPIQIEQSVPDIKQQKLTQEVNHSTKDTASHEIQVGSNEASHESAVEYRQHEQELLLEHHTLGAQRKRLQTLSVMRDSLYFTRIDFKEDHETETLYLGTISLRDLAEETIVTDWRAPTVNPYYGDKTGLVFHETKTDRIDIDLQLK